MSAPGEETRQRLDDLLATRAVEGLDPVETAELEALLTGAGDVDPHGFDEAAARFWLQAGVPEQELPHDVAARLEQRLLALDSGKVVPLPTGGGETTTASARPPRSSHWGWVAAAAALVLAITGWWPRSVDHAVPDLATARDELVRTAPDLVRADWGATDHPLAEGVEGYVVWSDQQQRGFMVFRGIPRNDPAENQYQLWVFDSARPDEYPVDGGVFNALAEDEEVIIPIDTRLPVEQAVLFAVTLEPPGGVVVSERDPILWLAEPERGA